MVPDFGGRTPQYVSGAVDPANANKLWLLVALAPMLENSPSYGLVSVTRNGGPLPAPVSAGPAYRIPSVAGETWVNVGPASSLVVKNGTLYALMWSNRRAPSYRFGMFSTTVGAWATAASTASQSLVTNPNFSVASAMGFVDGPGNTLYGYAASGDAWVVPFSCASPDTPATSSLTVVNASAGGAAVADGGTVFVGDQLTIGLNVVPQPQSRALASVELRLRLPRGQRDRGRRTSPRVRNPDQSLVANGTIPPASNTLVGPCDPIAGGVVATGAGCWASVLGQHRFRRTGLHRGRHGGHGQAAQDRLRGNELAGHREHGGLHRELEDPRDARRVHAGSLGKPARERVGRPPDFLQVVFRNGAEHSARGRGAHGMHRTDLRADQRVAHGHVVLLAHGHVRERLLDARLRCRHHSGPAVYDHILRPGLLGEQRVGRSAHGLHVPDASDPEQLAARLRDHCNVPGLPLPARAVRRQLRRPRAAGPRGRLGLDSSPNDSGKLRPQDPGELHRNLQRIGDLAETGYDPHWLPAHGQRASADRRLGRRLAEPCEPPGHRPADLLGDGRNRATYTAYEWSTTAGTFSTQQNPSFRASNLSNGDVTLPATCTVHDTAGGQGNNTVNVTIHKGTAPVSVNAYASPNPANPGNTVTLTCQATGGNGSYSYAWYGPTGPSFSSQQVFSFTASNGSSSFVSTTYTCTVTDGAGASGSGSVLHTVNGSGTPTPARRFGGGLAVGRARWEECRLFLYGVGRHRRILVYVAVLGQRDGSWAVGLTLLLSRRLRHGYVHRHRLFSGRRHPRRPRSRCWPLGPEVPIHSQCSTLAAFSTHETLPVRLVVRRSSRWARPTDHSQSHPSAGSPLTPRRFP